MDAINRVWPLGRFWLLLTVVALVVTSSAALAENAWTINDTDNDELPGRRVDISHKDRLVASFIYGKGQIKTYLSVYDKDGTRLTNPGLNSDGKTRGRFPHHRGIFIGWNRIHSDLGRDDLWHLRSGERMHLDSIESATTTDDAATLVLNIEWYSAKRDDDKQGLLIREQRTITVSLKNDRTVIDHESVLTAARDVRLEGDLQHAGTHFRADATVDDHRSQTAYRWAPADLDPGGGRIVSDDLKWVSFRFPLGDRWYSVTQLNPPANKVEELSWRDYGRFGFFFKDRLEQGQTLRVIYRFIIEQADGKSDDAASKAADSWYASFAELHPAK